jgi:hypothetical protein
MSNQSFGGRERSFGSPFDTNEPLPTLEEEEQNDRDWPTLYQENVGFVPPVISGGRNSSTTFSNASRNFSNTSSSTTGSSSSHLPPVRPKSPPPPRSAILAMKPRSMSPPRPPSSSNVDLAKMSRSAAATAADNDMVELEPHKPQSDSQVAADQSFRSSTYPNITTPSSSTVAFRNKQTNTFRSLSDVTGSRKRKNLQGSNTSHVNNKNNNTSSSFVSDLRRSLSIGATGGSSQPSSASSSSSGFTSNISRKSVLIRNSLAKRSTATLSRLGSRTAVSEGGDSKLSFSSSSVVAANSTVSGTGSSLDSRRTYYNSSGVVQNSTTRIYRGYAQGDMVLVIRDCNDDEDEYDHKPPRYPDANATTVLVNQYGYPIGEGNTVDEQRGPYLYILGKVKQIHYEENAVYYTVTREDNGEDVRGDASHMAPIRTKEGLDAAKRAANGAKHDLELDDGRHANGNVPDKKECILQCLENCCVLLLLPFIWIYDIFIFVIGARLFRWGQLLKKSIRRQSNLFLNGLPPYSCSARLTTVNIIVLCSTWYMFIDQIRLAFFPASADYTLAVINFVIWSILTVELVFEVFIRPDRYFELIISDKAFTPTTVRFISGLHLLVEAVSLGFFVPEFWCLFDNGIQCDGRPKFSFLRATLMAVVGSTEGEALAGRAFYACVRLRVFGLVRHWRNMWIRKTFIKRNQKGRFVNDQKSVDRTVLRKGPSDATSVATSNTRHSSRGIRLEQKQRDAAVINASNIGTALMVTNSYRSLTMLCLLMGIFPMVSLIYFSGVVNPIGADMIAVLQGTNLQVNVENSTNCLYFLESVTSWIDSFAVRNQSTITTTTEAFLLGLAIKPPRCIDYFSNSTIGGISFFEGLCPQWDVESKTLSEICIIGQLDGILGNTSLEIVSETLNLRVGNIVVERAVPVNQSFTTSDAFFDATAFAVSASYNYTYSTEASALLSFLLQLCLLLSVLISLIILRYDAEHLVLRPLRSMLKIVARYAKNPLSQATQTGRDNFSAVSESESEHSIDDDASEGDGFGTYETEQLISAVSKITDLLRKCWGVAGADIISTNLASREGELAEVFNPTVPGKSVYALFAFAAINGFDHALKCLGGDVMILINDVAQVLHGEVFRWGFGDSGQCNKNLGNAFLMVFRIGLVKEVVEKLEEATRVVFSTSEVKKISLRKRSREKLPAHVRKSSTDSNLGSNFHGGLKRFSHTKKQDSVTDAMQLSLQSLPGISTFTDRAVIGMLKSFAGIHRDNKLRNWSRDFRLSAGVGAWSVNMIFGMDAGWAVEGAVGSEYKIDATYLSPHVNMASRMMSACKHYGVTILLSEAVQELMSDQAKSRLRNLDRVTVKGSTQVQNIYTFDARSKGADFFLYSRSDEQANLEAERYQPNIWFDDQDLKAMRHHLTDDFEQEFITGMKFYYEGNWPVAIQHLELANEIMVDAAMEEGYLHDEMDDTPDRKELYRTETADGPCKYLINFMKSQGGEAPPNWDGWHPLLSK